MRDIQQAHDLLLHLLDTFCPSSKTVPIQIIKEKPFSVKFVVEDKMKEVF